MTYFTDDQIRFLRHVLDALTDDVQQREERINARNTWGSTVPLGQIDEAERLVLAPLRELYDNVQGLGHKLVIVGLGSLVETTVRLMLQREAPAVAATLRARESYGVVRRLFERTWGTTLNQAADYAYANLVRLLANDYKHRGGFADLPASADAETHLGWQRHQQQLAGDFDWHRHVNSQDGKIDFGALPVAFYVDRVEAFLNEVQSWPLANPNGVVLR